MNISRRLSRASSGVCLARFATGLLLISRFANGMPSFSDPDAERDELAMLNELLWRVQN
jgi:hypothetical protein